MVGSTIIFAVYSSPVYLNLGWTEADCHSKTSLIHSAILSQMTSVTDRQTDRQTDTRMDRIAVASHGNDSSRAISLYGKCVLAELGYSII